jgi:ABC-type transport system involved in multi-copper enzyme maturation permease subunit
MTFLPVVARELRVASRRRTTYWSRFLTVTITILIGMFVYVGSHEKSSPELALDLFGSISMVAFIYCLATGIRSTADCLSEEKRDGTLGLLFLTDLKGYDVVGGKLVATSLNAFYGLLAIFPVLAIPLLMGGITNGEFWRMALVLANTFLLSLAVGMFMSSICTSPRKAMAGTLVVMLCLTLGQLLCDNLVSFVYRSPHLKTVLEYMNPCTALTYVSDAQYKAFRTQFWWSNGVVFGMCWLLLGTASYIVPRSWQDNPPGANKQRWRERWHRWSYGDLGERSAFRRRLLNINAFYWLAGRARLKPMHVWIVFFLLGCLWMWGALEQGREWLNGAVYLFTAFVLNTTLKIWVASEAGRRLGEERKMGALELLLSTPLSVKEILRGQFLALQRQFLGPVVVALVIEVVFLVAALQENRGDPGDASMIAAFGIIIMVLLVTDMLALASLAMWLSLTAKNPNRTTGMTVRRVLVLPWIIMMGLVLIGAAVASGSRSADPSGKFFLGLYFTTGIVTDLVFGLTAWQRLNSEFREVATQRFSLGPGWLRLLLNREKYSPSTPPTTAR